MMNQHLFSKNFVDSHLPSFLISKALKGETERFDFGSQKIKPLNDLEYGVSSLKMLARKVTIYPKKKYQARLRTEYSSLNQHLFSNNIVDSHQPSFFISKALKGAT